MSQRTYLTVLESGVGTYDDKYLEPKHPYQSEADTTQDISGGNYNQSQKSGYEPLRTVSGALKGSGGGSGGSGSTGRSGGSPSGDSASTAVYPSKAGVYLTTTPPDSGNSFDSTDTILTDVSQLNRKLPRIQIPDRKRPDSVYENDEDESPVCKRAVIATIIIVLVLGALGGAAYGIYYGVTHKNRSDHQLVIVYGEMNYTNWAAAYGSGFQDNFRKNMSDAIRADSVTSLYFKSTDIAHINDNERNNYAVVEFSLNFHMDKTKTNHGGLFGALTKVITDTFVKAGSVLLACITIIPEQYNGDSLNYNCSFNITDFTRVVRQ